MKDCKHAAFSTPDRIWQWDIGRYLNININIPETEIVHFVASDAADIIGVYPEPDGKSVRIPDEILQNEGAFRVYAYTAQQHSALTLAMTQFEISARPMPPEYVFNPEETAHITYPALMELVTDMRELESRWSNPSAEAVVSDEVSADVELTEDGVRFIFGLPQGPQGETGNGIASTVLNDDYTLTITFTDGTSYTTDSIRGQIGATGATGNGIANTVLNADYTLTITFTNGTTYTTPSIRGEKGEKGEKGETGGVDFMEVVNGKVCLIYNKEDEE